MSDERRDCWTCAKFKRVGKFSHECTADVKGGTMYEGWNPPCKNWKPVDWDDVEKEAQSLGKESKGDE